MAGWSGGISRSPTSEGDLLDPVHLGSDLTLPEQQGSWTEQGRFGQKMGSVLVLGFP